MFLTYVFFGIFLIFVAMFILCDGEAGFYDRYCDGSPRASCNIQSCNKSEEVPEKACALSTNIDVLLNWLKQRDNYKKDHEAIQDAFNAQNLCGEYLGVEIPEYQEDANIAINNLAPQQQRQ